VKLATDWDAYYRSTPGYTQFTRRITARRLQRVLAATAPHQSQPVSICELGGANSSFIDDIATALNVRRYHVVDLNAYGLGLLERRQFSCPVTTERADARAANGLQQFDLVFSVGLIEHFDPAGTADVLRGHFERCRPGGTVLVTFPTPTPPYRAIRYAAELTGQWKFPDERPLLFQEVEGFCRSRGEIIHRSSNWLIGLTQGYVATRKALAR